MSEWTPRVPDTGDEASERAARESQHQVLIDLLGAYADRELPPETTSQLEAHLVGCARCRRELSVHHALRRRLGVEPPVAAPPALRERIAAAVAATPVVVAPPASREMEQNARARRLKLIAWVAAGCVIIALAVGSAVAWRDRTPSIAVSELSAEASAIPLLREVVSDYRRVTAGDLPGRSRDLEAVRGAVPFPIAPLQSREVRLVGAWTTELAGEPAAVLAYRWDDRILLEYIVPEERFFLHPAVRRGVADTKLLAATDGSQRLVAWPTEAAGAILVGDAPLTRLQALGASELLARTVARGAQ